MTADAESFHVASWCQRSQPGRGERRAALREELRGMTSPAITGETVELLQTLIRNRCVNDGTPELGRRGAQRRRARDVPRRRRPRRRSGTSRRRAGRRSSPASRAANPAAPSLCLMGHTDVVPVNPERLEPRSVRRRARRRGRGVGPRRHRHAQPHRVDGGRVPSPRRDGVPTHGATSSTSPSPTRSRGARTAPDGWPTTSRRDPRRLRAHRERRPALGTGRGSRTSASTSARRAWRGAGSACGARPATARCRSAATTRS